jgi:predicted nucleotidyltransferase
LAPLVEFLVREYGATRIVLLGSLVREEARPGSDIDLLVHGLSPSKVFEAGAAADRMMGDVSVDLVPAEIARAEIRARAEQEGEVLLG